MWEDPEDVKSGHYSSCTFGCDWLALVTPALFADPTLQSTALVQLMAEQS
jgi:hypothetical protein